MNVYALKRIWFKTWMGVLAMAVLGVMVFLSPAQTAAAMQPKAQTGPFITVTYTDPINVRGGPNTVDYPIVGRLEVGATAPALGVSPKREWVQIAWPSAPNGTGWVYAAYVTVSGGELSIVEPPPTPTPPVTATLDLTLVAIFNSEPTRTRLPTFTPPPPLTVPAFSEDTSPVAGRVMGIFIVVLTLVGGIGLLVSFILRK